MPTVPTYERPQVQEQSLPGARFQEQAPIEAFGGGQGAAQVTQAASGIADTFTSIAAEEKKKADEVFQVSAKAKLSDLSTSIAVETSKLKGKDAGQAQEFAQKAYQDGVAEIQKDAANRDQRVGLQHIANHYWEGTNKHIQIHTASEFEKYDDNETKAFLSSSQNAVRLNPTDPQRVAFELSQQRDEVEKWATRKGIPLDSPQFKEALGETLSQTHANVIGGMLDAGNENGAKHYFETHRDDFTEQGKKDALSSFRHYEIDQNAEKKRQADILAQQQIKTQNAFLVKLANNELSTKDILNSNLDPFGSGGKETFIKLMQADDRKTDPGDWNDIFQRIHLPDGDPNKLQDENELNKLVINGTLGRKDLPFMREEILGTHTEEGKNRAAMLAGLHKVAEQALSKKNPLLGIQDPQGEENLLGFTKFARDAIQAKIRAGESYMPLLDPTSKDWLGRSIGQFARSPTEIIRDMTKFSPGTSTSQPLAPAQPNTLNATPQNSGTGAVVPSMGGDTKLASPRKPGETAGEYLKRTKGVK